MSNSDMDSLGIKRNKLLILCPVILLLAGIGISDLYAQKSGGISQETGKDSPTVEELIEWNILRTDIQKTGMFILGSWALTNFAVSGYSMTRTEGRDFYFHQMNVLWNTVNLAIAGFGYFGASGSPLDLGLLETIGEYRSFSRILVLNAALDVGYVMAGFYMKNRGSRSEKYKERLIGYGNSIILQGSFLFVFDISLALVNRNAMMGLAEAASLEVRAIPGGIGARLSW